jgi:hypothetical protein
MQPLATTLFALAVKAQLMGEDTTGIFGAGTAAPGSFSIGSLVGMLGPVLGMTRDTTGGTGPYKAGLTPVLTELPKQTVFRPKSVPAGVKLPVILWGNGLCAGKGDWFSKFLVEIASHGYFIMALGAPNGGLGDKTLATDMPSAIEWVYKNAGKGEYAYLDKTKIAAAGQSCGGLQAYSASVDPRVTLTGLFNSGLLNDKNAKHFEKLHAPVGFLLGGPSDVAFENVSNRFLKRIQLIQLPNRVNETLKSCRRRFR